MGMLVLEKATKSTCIHGGVISALRCAVLVLNQNISVLL
jgi:hypothetical protein